MSALKALISGLGVIVSIAYPPAAPIIGFIEKAEPYAEAALPIIQAAIKEGPGAFAAAKTAAPEFFAHLSDLGSTLKALTTGKASPASDAELAHLAAHVAGVDPPGWAHVDTQRWWDRAQGAA